MIDYRNRGGICVKEEWTMGKIRENNTESGKEKKDYRPKQILYVEPEDYFPPEIRKLFFEDKEEEEKKE